MNPFFASMSAARAALPPRFQRVMISLSFGTSFSRFSSSPERNVHVSLDGAEFLDLFRFADIEKENLLRSFRYFSSSSVEMVWASMNMLPQQQGDKYSHEMRV